jgi:ectoine hydroxylase-related dioxygenase (phytanoyl-CoA dioxygenase family)
VLIKRKFIPDDITAPYIAVRERLADISLPKYLGGWSSGTAYMHVPELRALSLYPPLMALYEHLISEPMMLLLNLTNWVSSDRDWHQDDYLNPPFVNGWYIAVWISLDTIDPDSGVFQYVPGSHRWPLMRGEKVRSFLPPADRTARNEYGAEVWPTLSQDYVGAAVEAEMTRTGAQAVSFLAERGDVLIWHGRLLHRGSPAKVRFAERRSLIAHYTGINHRPDVLVRAQDDNGMAYAVFHDPLV